MNYDLIIVGGGLTGNCLALALRHSGLKIALIEAQPIAALHAGALGDRALALAAGTVNALNELKVWQEVAHLATAITQIHISDKGHFGKTRLFAAQEKVPALGYVITARDLESYLASEVKTCSHITVYCPARVMGLMADDQAIYATLKHSNESLNLSAKLIVGADGGQSTVRQLLDIRQQVVDYKQTALVTTVIAAKSHQNIAYERFTPSGPLALLPQGTHHCSVVWTRAQEEAQALMLGSEADFLAQLQDCFGYRLGRLQLSAPRRAFPLSLIKADSMIAKRAAIIGNASHQLHPVAGQGFNLGLRDTLALATLISQQTELDDVGTAAFLQRFSQNRRSDQQRTIYFTDALVRIFSNEWQGLAIARSVGLTLLDFSPFAKRLMARQAMGLSQQ
jgi:2-octaprenyl-6-methoxyphenol hydroxylase